MLGRRGGCWCTSFDDAMGQIVVSYDVMNQQRIFMSQQRRNVTMFMILILMTGISSGVTGEVNIKILENAYTYLVFCGYYFVSNY